MALLIPLGILSALKWRVTSPAWFAAPVVVACLTLLGLAQSMPAALHRAQRQLVPLLQTSESSDAMALAALGLICVDLLLVFGALTLAIILVAAPGQRARWQPRRGLVLGGAGLVAALVLGLASRWSLAVPMALCTTIVVLPHLRSLAPSSQPDALVERRLHRLATGQATVGALVASAALVTSITAEALLAWARRNMVVDVATADPELAEKLPLVSAILVAGRAVTLLLILFALAAAWPLRRWLVDTRSLLGAGATWLMGAVLTVLLLFVLAS